MTKNYVGGPENMNEYWYPMDTEVANANLSLRDLFNRLIEEKLKKIENANKIGAVTNILSLNKIKQMAADLRLKLKSITSQDFTLYKDIIKSNKVDFGSGWHGKEIWSDVAFRWTDGEGVLNIMHKARNLKIKYRCIHKYDDMKLKVFADAILIYSESMIIKDAWTDIGIELNDYQAPLKLKIKTDFFIPKLCGISADQRKLGIAISEISCH